MENIIESLNSIEMRINAICDKACKADQLIDAMSYGDDKKALDNYVKKDLAKRLEYPAQALMSLIEELKGLKDVQ